MLRDRLPLATALVAMVFLLPPGAAAQDVEVPAAERRDGDFAFLFHVTFRPGKSDEGLDLLSEHLVPAWRDAGLNVSVFASLVGTRDVWIVLPLPEGPSALEWEVSPRDAASWAALVERAGGAGPAEAVVDRFVGLVERQAQELVHVPAWAGGIR